MNKRQRKKREKQCLAELNRDVPNLIAFALTNNRKFVSHLTDAEITQGFRNIAAASKNPFDLLPS